MDIKIYDYEFNLIDAVCDCIGAVCEVYYNKIGRMEWKFPYSSRAAELVTERKNLIFCGDGFCGIVVGCIFDKDSLSVYGRSMNYIFSKRLCRETVSGEDTVDVLCRQLIADAFMTSGSRGYTADFELLENDEFSQIISYSKEGCATLAEYVTEILDADNAGHELIFNTARKKWQFHILRGRELPLILSEANKTAHDSTYSSDLLNAFNAGVFKQSFRYMGEWSPSSNSPRLSEKSADNYECCYKISEDGVCFERQWQKDRYILCRDSEEYAWEQTDAIPDGDIKTVVSDSSQAMGIYLSEVYLGEKSTAEAERALCEYVEQRSASAASDMLFKRDYELGDIVRFQLVKGNFKKTFRLRIIGVRRSYSAGENTLIPIFEFMD